MKKYSETTRKILEAVKAQDRERYDKMLSALDCIYDSKRQGRMLVRIALAVNLGLLLAMFQYGNTACFFMTANMLAYTVGMLVNRRDELKAWSELEKLGFPFDKLREEM